MKNIVDKNLKGEFGFARKRITLPKKGDVLWSKK